MWTNVIGQERIKRIIRQSLEAKKLPGAYLFSGPEGVGKDAAAFELAKVVNCLSPLSGGAEACDECANCKSIGDLQSQLLMLVFAEASEQKTEKDKDEMIAAVREEIGLKAADPYHNIEIPKAITIGVDQIRDLRMLLSRSLLGGNKRVVIISEADTMRSDAQNAFLKTLEEPSQNTLIIMTSSNASKLLPTIHSRVQEIRFDLLTPDEISAALIERDGTEPEQATFLARLAGGSYSIARGMVNEDIAALRKQVVDLMLAGLSRSRRKTVEEIDKFLPRAGSSFLEKRQTVEQLLNLLSLWLRDALAIASGSESFIYNIDQLDYLKRFTGKFGDPTRILQALRQVDTAKRNTRMQLQLRPVVLTMVMGLEEALVTG